MIAWEMAGIWKFFFILVSCDRHSDGNTITGDRESQIYFVNEIVTVIRAALSVK